MTDYYNIPALSYSGIKKYQTDGPHSFWRTSVLNPNRIPEEPSAAMIKGKVAHALLLEPENFDSQFAIKNKVDGRTVAGKQYNEQFLLSVGTREVIDEVLYADVRNMAAALKANPDFQSLAGSPDKWIVEEEFFWTDDSGIKRKAKMDLIVNQSGNPIIIDYKTCQNCDPSHFRNDIIKFKYYMQDPYYKEAFRQKHGAEPRFVFVAQEVDFPDNIAMYELQAADVAVGKRELDRAIGEIKVRLANNDWKPYAGGVQQLDLPTWFYTRQQENELISQEAA